MNSKTPYLLETFNLDSCNELEKRTIRPFTLQYLALGVVLNSSRHADDDKNQLIIYRHLFEGDVFRRFLENFKYNVLSNKTRVESNGLLYFVRRKLFSKLVCADILYNYLSQSIRVRNEHFFGLIQTVDPWCKCHVHVYCSLMYVKCEYGCTEKTRLLNAHYSHCDQLH